MAKNMVLKPTSKNEPGLISFKTRVRRQRANVIKIMRFVAACDVNNVYLSFYVFQFVSSIFFLQILDFSSCTLCLQPYELC